MFLIDVTDALSYLGVVLNFVIVSNTNFMVIIFKKN